MSVLNDQNLTDLATVKDMLKIGQDDTANDNILQMFIEQASSTLLLLANRKYLLSQYVTEVVNGNGQVRMLLEATPVTAISSITDSQGRSISAAANWYSVGYHFDDYSVILSGDMFFFDERYTIIYQGGISTNHVKAAAAEKAVLSMVNFWFKKIDVEHLRTQAQGNQIMTTYITDDIPEIAKTIARSLKKVA